MSSIMSNTVDQNDKDLGDAENIVLKVNKWTPSLEAAIINLKSNIVEKYIKHLIQVEKLSIWNITMNSILFLMNLAYSILIQFRMDSSQINLVLQITIPLTTALTGFISYSQLPKEIEKHNLAANRYKLMINTIDLYLTIPNSDKTDINQFLNYLSTRDTEITRAAPILPANIKKLKEKISSKISSKIEVVIPHEQGTSEGTKETTDNDEGFAKYVYTNNFKRDIKDLDSNNNLFIF